ncbi:MAG: hypothetical protein H5U07_06540, partial [Candidatus Aminicenantes bacterium]|nr:hypothetical protein [Candidatus Aminicenantes bacterium]
MKKTLTWILAFLITASSAVYQRITGPTYPTRGVVNFLGQEIKFKLPRSAENVDHARVIINLGAS